MSYGITQAYAKGFGLLVFFKPPRGWTLLFFSTGEDMRLRGGISGSRSAKKWEDPSLCPHHTPCP